MKCGFLFIQFVLCAAFRLTAADHIEGCSLKERVEYISKNLSPECTSSLSALQQDRHGGREEQTSFVPATSDLDAVCQQSCGGLYSIWLQNECRDPYSSRMVEVMCVFTAGTTNIGQRCRSAFPDAIDGLHNIFSEVLTCGLGSDPNSCSPRCLTAMTTLISTLGCCYQSLYNNTDFTQYLLNIGFINMTHVTSLNYLAKASEWEVCNITRPPMCEFLRPKELIPATISSAVALQALTYAILYSIILTMLCNNNH